MYIDELEVSFEKNDFQNSEKVISQKIDFFHDIFKAFFGQQMLTKFQQVLHFQKVQKK